MRKISECYKQIHDGTDVCSKSIKVYPNSTIILIKETYKNRWKSIIVNKPTEKLHFVTFGYSKKHSFLDKHFIRIKEKK